MAGLYTLSKTNTDERQNQETKKVEILYDLKGNAYKIFDTDYKKRITCLCGSCELILNENESKESITLDKPNNQVYIENNIFIELKNYTEKTKITIEYLGE